jgi:hypothetical protein
MANGTTAQTRNTPARAAETAPVAVSVANGGTAPSTSTAAPTVTPSAAETEEKKRGRGAIPTMPICAVYQRQDGKCVAAVVSPKGERYEAVGRGQGSAMGELTDMGFTLSGLHSNAPIWVEENKAVPEGCKVFGFATISGFPLPKQGD